MVKTKKHIIFTTDYNEDDYKEAYEEWLEMNKYTPEDRSLEEYIQDSIGIWAEDEYANLKKDCGDIICIADLGLWNGRHSGYKLNKKGILNAIFDMIHADDYEVYVEGNDIKATVHHHDGTNYLIFREVRKDRNIQKLCDMLYDGEEITRQMISSYTKPLGNVVKDIFGW